MSDKITQITTHDSAMILDQAEGEYVEGWLRVYKRQVVRKLLDGVSVGATVISSDSFFSAPYFDFLILLDALAVDSGTALLLYVEVSDDGVNWYRLRDSDVDNIELSSSDGTQQKVALRGVCLSPYIRLSALADAASWTVTAKLVLNS